MDIKKACMLRPIQCKLLFTFDFSIYVYLESIIYSYIHLMKGL